MEFDLGLSLRYITIIKSRFKGRQNICCICSLRGLKFNGQCESINKNYYRWRWVQTYTLRNSCPTESPLPKSRVTSMYSWVHAGGVPLACSGHLWPGDHGRADQLFEVEYHPDGRAAHSLLLLLQGDQGGDGKDAQPLLQVEQAGVQAGSQWNIGPICLLQNCGVLRWQVLRPV